jgi:hypothetical protein
MLAVTSALQQLGAGSEVCDESLQILEAMVNDEIAYRVKFGHDDGSELCFPGFVMRDAVGEEYSSPAARFTCEQR